MKILEILIPGIVALVFVVLFGVLAYYDYKRMKAETDTRIKTMESICLSLRAIKRMLNEKQLRDKLTYVQEMRLYHSCAHCQFLEQCKMDAEQEGILFDYLVCEEFREV